MGTVLPASELDRIRKDVENEGSWSRSPKKDDAGSKVSSHSENAAFYRAAKYRHKALAKKLAQRREKQEREEAERLQIDAEEAEIREANRAAVLERANRLKLESSGQYAAVRSSLMQADVDAARREQIAIQKELQALEKEIDDQHVAQQNQRCEAMLQYEKEQADVQRKLRAVTKKMLEEKLKEVEHLKAKQAEEKRKEAVKMQQQMKDEADAKLEQDARERQQKKQALEDIHAMNKALQEKKKERREEERREEEAIQRYRDKKDNISIQMKQREQEILKNKLDARQKIIDERAAHLAGLKSDEEAKLARDIHSAQAKEERAKEDEMKRKQKEKELLDLQRKQQIELQQRQKSEKRSEEARMLEHLTAQVEQSKAQDEEDTRKQALAEQQLADFRRLQMELKRLRDIQEKRNTDAFMHSTLQHNREADQRFVNSAYDRLMEHQRQGRDVRSAIRTLEKLRTTKR